MIVTLINLFQIFDTLHNHMYLNRDSCTVTIKSGLRTATSLSLSENTELHHWKLDAFRHS